jgi:DNA-binding transcriptional regulator YiaG
MTAEELLRRYPRETLRWLRRRLGLSQLALAPHLGVNPKTLANWEARRHGIADAQRATLAALLAPHLATPAGAAFARSLGRGEEGGDG